MKIVYPICIDSVHLFPVCMHTAMHWCVHMFDYITADLAHDGNGSLACGRGHLVLNQVEHVLIKEKADEVEGPKAGCAPQGEVSYHHGAEVKEEILSCQQLDLQHIQCHVCNYM